MDYYMDMIASVGCRSLKDLLILSVPLYLKSHRWNIEDDVAKVYSAKEQHIRNVIKLLEIEVEIDGQIEYRPGYEVKNVDYEALHFGTFEFFELIYDDMKRHKLDIPSELYEILGIADEGKKKKLRDQTIDKAVCQGIARTLWETDPNMTIEKMVKSRPIQVFGNGAQYKDGKTIRGWISEVDERTSKRGRKKKIVEKIDHEQGL